MKKIVAIYLGWLLLAVLLPLLKDGLDAKNVTVLCAVAFLGLQLLLRPLLAKAASRLAPRVCFVAAAVVAACFLEAFHMISQPFDPALLVTRGMSAAEVLSRLGVDLLFTVPSYLVIFSVVWRLAGHYRFSRLEYFLLVSLGQCLGDGGLLFFVGAPFMLPFLPYALVKYQAMNFVPYLLVRDRLAPRSGSRMRYVVPVVLLFATYLCCGAVMNTLWAHSRWGAPAP
jgi:hypothetical protein